MTKYRSAVGSHSGALGPRGSRARQLAAGDGGLNFDEGLILAKGVADLVLDGDVIRK